MNWIIRSTKKVKFHTNLQEVLKPIWNDLAIYKWILTDLDFISDQTLPINFDEDYFVLDHPEFEQLYQSNTQIIWRSFQPFQILLNPILQPFLSYLLKIQVFGNLIIF
ncbi:MAG: hypothetical protein E6Q35_06600 [Chryseobacterium cucumeris]|nr:MAG: hypothetical protein E6Q35_06600 [Chryseobacterium cucumeris]